MVVAVLISFAALMILFIVAALIGFQFRSRDPAGSSPAWSPHFSPEQYERFLDHVRTTVQSCGLQATISRGSISLATGVSTRDLPLADFADACRDRPEAEWDEQIAQQLSRLTADYEIPDLAYFDAVKHLLAVQIGISPGLSHQSVVAREYLPSAPAILVLNLPAAIRTIHPSELAAWHQTPDDLFQIAIANTRQGPAPKQEIINIADGVPAYSLTGPSPFTATRALLLEDHKELIGPFGSLLIIPTRHILIAHPISGATIRDAQLPLAWIATRRYNDGPASITPNLYWYYNGTFTHLPYELTGRSLRLHPPKSFTELLETFSPPIVART